MSFKIIGREEHTIICASLIAIACVIKVFLSATSIVLKLKLGDLFFSTFELNFILYTRIFKIEKCWNSIRKLKAYIY